MLNKFLITYKKTIVEYIKLVLLLLVVAFGYALHHGELKILVEILKVAKGILDTLLSVPFLTP